MVQSGLPLAETIPLFSKLLSIRLGAKYASPESTPEQQKQQTMRALITVAFRRAARQPVLFIVEDLHWVDPTTLELLNMLVDEIHSARILAVFTFRPDFSPPWAESSNVTVLDISRLPSDEVAELTHQVAQGKSLPAEVVAEMVSKTDGVPLFVEELTKTLLESGLLEEREDRYELTRSLPPLAIPNTLQDSLMARLDRLAAVKVWHNSAPLSGASSVTHCYRQFHRGVTTPCEGLEQLVAAEFLYEQGHLPQASYRFKPALIQAAAYQSLLKSTRQQHHQRIAAVLESRFPDTAEKQPELLAHHYTEAGLTAQAIPYWQAAGQRALQRSANREAANHATRGLELLDALPDTHQRAEQELALRVMLGAALGILQGYQSLENVYARACELAQQVGSPPELFPALWGSWYAHMIRGHLVRARALAQEFLQLADQRRDRLVLAEGHRMLANTAWWQGYPVEAHDHSQRALGYYDPKHYRASLVSYGGQDAGVACGWIGALSLWTLGYPDKAQRTMEGTLARARSLAHPSAPRRHFSFPRYSTNCSASLRRRAHAQDALAICTERGFGVRRLVIAAGGWAIAQQGEVTKGIADIHEALAA